MKQSHLMHLAALAYAKAATHFTGKANTLLVGHSMAYEYLWKALAEGEDAVAKMEQEWADLNVLSEDENEPAVPADVPWQISDAETMWMRNEHGIFIIVFRVSDVTNEPVYRLTDPSGHERYYNKLLDALTAGNDYDPHAWVGKTQGDETTAPCCDMKVGVDMAAGPDCMVQHTLLIMDMLPNEKQLLIKRIADPDCYLRETTEQIGPGHTSLNIKLIKPERY